MTKQKITEEKRKISKTFEKMREHHEVVDKIAHEALEGWRVSNLAHKKSLQVNLILTIMAYLIGVIIGLNIKF